MEAAEGDQFVRHGGAVGSGAAEWRGAVVDQVATAMCSGTGFDVSGSKKQEAAAGDGPPFDEKTAKGVLHPDQSRGPRLRGAYLVGCIGSFW